VGRRARRGRRAILAARRRALAAAEDEGALGLGDVLLGRLVDIPCPHRARGWKAGTPGPDQPAKLAVSLTSRDSLRAGPGRTLGRRHVPTLRPWIPYILTSCDEAIGSKLSR